MTGPFDAVAHLRWSPGLTVIEAAGDCAGVLGTGVESLPGRPLGEVLRMSAERAGALDARARQEGPFTEFLPSPRAGATVLRACVASGQEGGECTLIDMQAALSGAPPLQIAPLSSSLSHEIRNPLSSVKMAVQTLARNPELSERDKRRLVIANREIRTMERMLWLLSEYGRDTPPSVEMHPLRAAVVEAAALIEPELAERRIQVGIVEEEPPPRCGLDLGRLRAVLAQLLLNVAMGQPEGTPLMVELRHVAGGCQLVLLDAASAVPPDEEATLFEPFGSRLARGAGLSLAALRRVMKLHGGDVTARGSAQPGTVFTLFFPA